MHPEHWHYEQCLFHSIQSHGAEPWILPVIQGFIEIKEVAIPSAKHWGVFKKYTPKRKSGESCHIIIGVGIVVHVTVTCTVTHSDSGHSEIKVLNSWFI